MPPRKWVGVAKQPREENGEQAQPVLRELAELQGTSALTWDQLQDLQLRHDQAFHKDVMASSPSYQLRHSLMHLHKVVGSLAAFVEKTFHGEAINDITLELTERRLPDLQAFILKIGNLVDANLGKDLAGFGTTIFRAPSEAPSSLEWLERQLVDLQSVVAHLAKHHQALLVAESIPKAMQTDIRSALPKLQAVAFALAGYLAVDLGRSYRERLLGVERRKLA